MTVHTLYSYRPKRSCKLKLNYKHTLYAVNKQDEKKKQGARFSRAGLDLRNLNAQIFSLSWEVTQLLITDSQND